MKSEDIRRYWTCWRKVVYMNRGTAESVVLEKQKNFGQKWMHAYRCPYCKFWHIGHMKKSKRRPQQ